MLKIVTADLNYIEHQQIVLDLINAYSMDPMGNGHPLPEEVKRNLVPGLAAHPTTVIFIAFDDQKPAGIAVCFYGFSTFAAKPLINIHDLAVLPEYRGKNIGRKLLEAVEQKAIETGCCKVTLEVLENNHKAKRVYLAAGFSQASYTKEAGGALFFAKHLKTK